MNEISVGIGESEDIEGFNMVHLHIHDEGTLALDPERAIIYGQALIDFGRAAKQMNEEEGEEAAKSYVYSFCQPRR